MFYIVGQYLDNTRVQPNHDPTLQPGHHYLSQSNVESDLSFIVSKDLSVGTAAATHSIVTPTALQAAREACMEDSEINTHVYLHNWCGSDLNLQVLVKPRPG